MTPWPEHIVIELLSDTTFGRGEGTPGVVDVEVEHDAYGLPMLGGKALRGLLRDSWLSMQDHFPELHAAGQRVLGPHGDLEETAILRIGDAVIEAGARDWFISAIEREQHPLAPETILAALTEIRSQTSEERTTGAPARTTLRSTRVMLRGLTWQHHSPGLRRRNHKMPSAWLSPPSRQGTPALRATGAVGTCALRSRGISNGPGRSHAVEHELRYAPYTLSLGSPAIVTVLRGDPNSSARISSSPVRRFAALSPGARRSPGGCRTAAEVSDPDPHWRVPSARVSRAGRRTCRCRCRCSSTGTLHRHLRRDVGVGPRRG